MSDITDQAYLKNDQYRDSSNLDARLTLHQRFSTNPQGWFPWVFATLEKLPPRARVLELGCGPGTLWSTCANRIPPGWIITLSDLSNGMLLEAWRNLVVTGRAFKYEQIDAQAIPYPDETFDIVIANFMLYHIPDRPKALHEIRRVLKPGGTLVAATCGVNHLRELDEWLEQVGPGKNYSLVSISFTLESGGPELETRFSDVKCLRYDDGLQIPEIDPLMAYFRSGLLIRDLSEAELLKLRQILETELLSKRVLSVTKDAGLFLAVRRD